MPPSLPADVLPVLSFGKKLTSVSFRRALATGWADCCEHQGTVHLDLRMVEWVALPTLMELCLLALRLRESGARPVLHWPACSLVSQPDGGAVGDFERRQLAFSFLIRMDLDSWCKRHDVTCMGADQEYLRFTDLEDPDQARLVPITEFVGAAACSAAFSAVRTREGLRRLIESFGCLRPVDSLALEGSLGHELGENAYWWCEIDVSLPKGVADILQGSAAVDATATNSTVPPANVEPIVPEHLGGIRELEGRSFSSRYDLMSELAAFLGYDLARQVIAYSRAQRPATSMLAARLVKCCPSAQSEMLPTESRYYSRIVGRPYLEVVVADSGIGIPARLWSTVRDDDYQKSEIRPLLKWARSACGQDEEAAMDAAALRFAFGQQSTSRGADRFAEPDVPRGLWWVLDVCSSYGGYVGASSGKAKVGIDLVSDAAGLGTCVPQAPGTSGTIVQVILPDRAPDRPPYASQRRVRGQRGAEPRKPIVVQCQPSIEDTIKGICLTTRRRDASVLLLDFAGADLEEQQILRVFQYAAHHSSPPGDRESGKLWAVVNVPETNEQVQSAIRAFCSTRSSPTDFRFRLIPILFTSGRCTLIGPGAPATQRLLDRVLADDSVLEPTEDELALRIGEDWAWSTWKSFLHLNRHFVTVGQRNELQAALNRESLLGLLLDGIQSELACWVDDAWEGDHPLHHAAEGDRWFLLPSGAIAQEYYELLPLLSRPAARRSLAHTLVTLLAARNSDAFTKVDWVVGTTASAIEFAREVCATLRASRHGDPLLGETYVDRYVSEPTDSYLDEVKPRSTVLIATDVVSGGNQVRNIELGLQKRDSETVGVVAVMDLREEGETQSSGPQVISVIRRPTRRLHDPERTRVCGNPQVRLIAVDRVTATPVFEDLSPPVEPLMMADSFLSEFCSETDAVINAHVEGGPNHSVFYIHTAEVFGDPRAAGRIASIVVDAFSNSNAGMANEAKDTKPVALVLLMTPSGSNAALILNEVRGKLRQELKSPVRVKPYVVPRWRTSSGWRIGAPSERVAALVKATREVGPVTALVFDDGWNSGDTWRQLVDTAVAVGVDRVVGCVVVSRQEPFLEKALSGVWVYVASTEEPMKAATVRTRVLTSLHIRPYPTDACPLCKRTAELGDAQQLAERSRLALAFDHYLSHESRRLRIVKVHDLGCAVRNSGEPAFAPAALQGQFIASPESRGRTLLLAHFRELLGRIDDHRPREPDRQTIETGCVNSDRDRTLMVCLIRDEPHLWEVLKRECPTAAAKVKAHCLGAYYRMALGEDISAIPLTLEEALAHVECAFRVFGLSDAAAHDSYRPEASDDPISKGGRSFIGVIDDTLLMQCVVFQAWSTWPRQSGGISRLLEFLDRLEQAAHQRDLLGGDGRRYLRAALPQIKLWATVERARREVLDNPVMSGVRWFHDFYLATWRGHPTGWKPFESLFSYDERAVPEAWQRALKWSDGALLQLAELVGRALRLQSLFSVVEQTASEILVSLAKAEHAPAAIRRSMNVLSGDDTSQSRTSAYREFRDGIEVLQALFKIDGLIHKCIPSFQTDLADVIDFIDALLKERASEVASRSLRIEHEYDNRPGQLFFARVELLETVRHLVDHAIRACPSEGRVGVSLRLEGQRCTFAVENEIAYGTAPTAILEGAGLSKARALVEGHEGSWIPHNPDESVDRVRQGFTCRVWKE